jgi:hypothetical protein
MIRRGVYNSVKWVHQSSLKFATIPQPQTNLVDPFKDAFTDPFKETTASVEHSDTLTMHPFDAATSKKLQQAVNVDDVEVKPDGILYVPEIKYRRALTNAFGPGGWGLVPKSPHSIVNKTLSREYALYCHGRFVSQARGEQEFYSEDGVVTATEGVKSNAMMRCCKVSL